MAIKRGPLLGIARAFQSWGPCIGGPAASSAPISDRRKNPAVSAARWVFGDLFAADRGTALNRSSGSLSSAGEAASLCPAIYHGGSRSRVAGKGSWPQRGFRALDPFSPGCGILVVLEWISKPQTEQFILENLGDNHLENIPKQRTTTTDLEGADSR